MTDEAVTPPPHEGATASRSGAKRTLDSTFARGIAWTGTSRLASQIVSWGSFLAVARILSQEDFGVVAASASLVGLVALVAEFGLGTAIVAKADLSDAETSQLTGVALVMGLLAWSVCAVLGWPASHMLRVPELTRVLPVVGLSVGLATLNAIPTAILRRNLAFRTISQIEMAKSVLGAGTVLALALAGFGFWSQVLGDVVAAGLMSALLFRFTRLVPKRPQWSGIADTMRDSREVLLSRAAWYMYSNADFAVVSRRLGSRVLGDYSMAWTLINLPMEKVATLIFAVTPSIFARVRNDLAEFRRYVLLLIESLALLLMPMSAGLGLVAGDAVTVVLGERWHGATPIIQALAVFVVAKSIAPMSSQILVSCGNAAAARRQSFWGLAILPVSFLAASRYGAVAVALVWTGVYPILIALQLREAAREIGLPMRAIWGRLAPILASTAVMSVSVLAAQQLALATSPPIWRLGACVIVGAVAYVGAIWLLARERVASAVALVRTRR